jgi:O-antigen ligase
LSGSAAPISAAAPTAAAPGVLVPAHLFGDVAIFLGVASSCVVMFEPAPYDALLGVTALGAFLFGLRIPRALAPLFVLMILFQAGGILAVVNPIVEVERTRMFVITSLFLAFTCLYFACTVADRPERMRIILKAYLAAAVVAALLGVFGYFSGSETFTRYGRAKGAFKDPNVYGPFLSLPSLILARVLLTRSLLRALPVLPIFFVLLIGVFLSFSRAAWFLFAFGVAGLWLVLFLDARGAAERFRLAVIAVVGLMLVLVLLAVVISIPEISAMFEERAKLVQSYDGARLGRLARYSIGFEWVTRMPFGQGPLEFGVVFGEDPHNVYLKAFLGYGWLGGLAFLGLVFGTLARLAPLMFGDRPWKAEAQVIFVSLLGHAIISWVIDADHWRHYYLLWGLAWGIVALDARRRRAGRLQFEENQG